MLSRELLKEVIVSYDDEINNISNIVKRENFILPEKLKKAVNLYGVRRSGKTYCLYDVYKKYCDRALYLDFEDDRLEGFTLKDFDNLKDAFLELKPGIPAGDLVYLLDEVQNIKGWEKFVRRAVEKENIKVFVTGSSSKMTSMQFLSLLRGRSWGIEIFPFSFREYLNVKGIKHGNFYGGGKHLLKSRFMEYLRWGGFPEICVLEKDVEKNKVIKEYLDAIFFKDLVERFKITNIPLLESMREKLFSSFSQKISLNAFYRQMKDKLPFSKDSLFLYYKYFIESMICFEVKKFSSSAYKRMRNPAKVYLVDVALARRVASEDRGRLLENVVFMGLKRAGSEIYYFEDKNECDFIEKDQNGRLSPYQVCWEINEGNRDREINGLVNACSYLGVKRGKLLTFDYEGETKKNGIKIEFIPVWKWLIKYCS